MAVCRIALVSDISTMKVDWPRTRLSLAPTRVKRRSTIHADGRRRAGTKLPMCASRTMSPTWRRIVDLPAMFGPVRMITRAAGVEMHVVGDELFARHHPLDHRVPTAA